jgi:hypothetical protein
VAGQTKLQLLVPGQEIKKIKTLYQGSIFRRRRHSPIQYAPVWSPANGQHKPTVAVTKNIYNKCNSLQVYRRWSKTRRRRLRIVCFQPNYILYLQLLVIHLVFLHGLPLAGSSFGYKTHAATCYYLI